MPYHSVGPDPLVPCVVYLLFLIIAAEANTKVKMDRDVMTDSRFMPNGVKFRNKPVSMVIVKLNATDKANLSIMSSELFAGNNVSIKQ